MFVETAYIPLQCLEILQQTLPYITQGNTAKLHRFLYHFESKILPSDYHEDFMLFSESHCSQKCRKTVKH
jgi:hypothetical protein